ncbi:hypothetical protein EVAR_20762_1 [Eumeta japonica]|uniref:Uncharacterized protein n=1 Tax=Eumeta variegata TaxID=151549 RepID=A0A4C1V9P6_EUMVA|nr:hypothetical protein EVAR_20762_1 [Eumeta japonica]
MRSLRGMSGVSRKDRCRNSDARERCGLKEDVVSRVDRGQRPVSFECAAGSALHPYAALRNVLINHDS